MAIYWHPRTSYIFGFGAYGIGCVLMAELYSGRSRTMSLRRGVYQTRDGNILTLMSDFRLEL